MNDYETLNHTSWDCKYHIVFIPKRHRKVLIQELRKHLGDVFRQIAAQRESKIEEGHLMPDHVHMLISSPPSTRFRRWLDTSRARAQSIWLARTGSVSS